VGGTRGGEDGRVAVRRAVVARPRVAPTVEFAVEVSGSTRWATRVSGPLDLAVT
jgi:predicted ABC-type transport system involved in lysophospholipase L1 biosynthesis ATPase subunit